MAGRACPDPQTPFFLSYAPASATSHAMAKRLSLGLLTHIQTLVHVRVDSALGFFDHDGIDPAVIWDEESAQALGVCQVLGSLLRRPNRGQPPSAPRPRWGNETAPIEPLPRQTHKRCEVPDMTAEQRRGAGQIVTFYSFQGGTGRTMALANVAWILAANGERVLIADWDLESPGLHRFFQPFMDPGVAQLPGVVDFIRTYEWQMEEEIGRLRADNLLDEEAMRWKQSALDAIAALIDENVSGLSRLVKPVGWQFPGRGAIDFLSPGAHPNDGVYAQALSALDWDTLYDKLNGGQFLTALRERLKGSYDWILIDSRTGLSEIASICTLHLPDTVIDCFTLSRQGLEGAEQVAGQIEAYTSREINVLPVPMRIDHSREDKVVDGLDAARELFAGLPANMSDDQRAQYWAEVQVPYRPLYAYEETLAVFGDRPGVTDSLLSSYERVAARITANKVSKLPPMQEWLRLSTWRMFSRSAVSRAEIVVDFSPQDQLWAEWIAAALASAGHSARLAGEQARRTGDGGDPPRVVGVLSDFYLSRREDSEFATALEFDSAGDDLGGPEYLIDIADTHVPSGVFDGVPVGFIGDLPEERAVRRLIEELGGARRRRTNRWPGASATPVTAPAGSSGSSESPPVTSTSPAATTSCAIYARHCAHAAGPSSCSSRISRVLAASARRRWRWSTRIGLRKTTTSSTG